MKLKEGEIIYFNPFYFKNGNTAKAKYFIVLKNFDNNYILATLPTRKDFIPAASYINDGCIELPEINFNCFIFSEKTKVTECGKTFDFPTHIYGYQLDHYDLDTLNEIYPLENKDYEIWGVMNEELFLSLKQCLSESKAVKRKYKKLLSQ